jgi:TP901 family phage tail tape measure protein
MPTTVAQLVVAVTANTKAAEQDLAALATTMSKVAGPMTIAVLAVGAAIVGTAVAATKMAGDFQAGITTLVTGAGEAQKSIGMVSQGILQMAVATGTSTQQLIAGMFMIESAGYHGAAGLQVLQAAAEGAKVGNADLGTVADAVTTIMKDYGISTNRAADVTNLLIDTVASGKTHMEYLAGSISTVLPVASKFGVSLGDIMGGMATMTSHGIAAANAATYLRQMIVSLEAPTAAGTKALNSVGLTTAQVAAEMRVSLPGALLMIQNAINKTFGQGTPLALSAMKEIAGGSRQMMGYVALTGSSLNEFTADAQKLGVAARSTSSTIVGWGLVQQTFNYKMSVLGEVVQTLMIRLGQQLLPVATKLATLFATVLPQALNATGVVIQFIRDHFLILSPLIGVVAGVIGGLLVAALTAMALAAWAALAPVLIFAAPFIVIGAAIGMLIVALVALYTHWTGFRLVVQAVVTGLVNLAITVKNVTGDILGFFGDLPGRIGTIIGSFFNIIGTMFSTGWNDLITSVADAINTVIGWFTTAYNHSYLFKMIVDTIVQDFTDAKALIATIWNTITTYLVGQWNSIKSMATTIWNTITSYLGGQWNAIVGMARTAWNAFVAVITANINAARNAVTAIINAIKAVFGPLAGELFTIGKNIIQGLINGIGSMLGAVKNAIGNVAGAIKNGVTSALGIHSPSTVFAEYGAAMGQGLLQGLAAQNVPGNVRALLTGVGSVPGISSGGSMLPPVSGGGSITGLPASSGGSSSGGNFGGPSGGPMIIQLHLDGRKVAEIVTKYQPGVIRNATGARAF